MPVYPNSKITSIYYDNSDSQEYPCQVRIDDKKIIVDYDSDGERIIYEGEEKGNGHYELKSTDVNGEASLHRFDGDNEFEGSWVEGGARGMWKIEIA